MIEQARRRQFLEMHRRSGSMTRPQLIKHITSATAHGGRVVAMGKDDLKKWTMEELRRTHGEYHAK